MPFGGEDEFEDFVDRENLDENEERRLRYFDSVLSNVIVQKATGRFHPNMWESTFKKIGQFGWEFEQGQVAMLKELDEKLYDLYRQHVAGGSDIIEAEDDGEVPVSYTGPTFHELTGRDYR